MACPQKICASLQPSAPPTPLNPVPPTVPTLSNSALHSYALLFFLPLSIPPYPPFPSHQLPRPHKQKAFKTHLHTLHTTPYRREVDHVELEWGRGTEGDHMLRQKQPQKLKRETKNHMCLCMRAYVAQYSKVNRCPACIYRILRIEIGGMDTGYNGIVNFSTNNAIHSILLLEVFYSLVLPAGTSSPSLTSILRSRHPGRV